MYPGVECVASRKTTSTSYLGNVEGGDRDRERIGGVVKGVKVHFRLLRFQFVRRERRKERKREVGLRDVPADVPARVRD